MPVDPVILGSARKHWVHDDDILHAYRYPTRVFDLDDLTKLIGAATDGQLLEIGVVDDGGIEFVVHAMTAREKFLR
jgi:hypothetical protein